jgi:hypothetical protein
MVCWSDYLHSVRTSYFVCIMDVIADGEQLDRLTGFLPFYDKNHTILFEKIQNVDYNWDDCPEVSPAGTPLEMSCPVSNLCSETLYSTSIG